MANEPPKNEPLPPGTLLPFPTPRQQSDFLKLREQGMISVFRARACDACKKETPEAYRFCGEVCHNKVNPPKKAP